MGTPLTEKLGLKLSPGSIINNGIFFAYLLTLHPIITRHLAGVMGQGFREPILGIILLISVFMASVGIYFKTRPVLDVIAAEEDDERKRVVMAADFRIPLILFSVITLIAAGACFGLKTLVGKIIIGIGILAIALIPFVLFYTIRRGKVPGRGHAPIISDILYSAFSCLAFSVIWAGVSTLFIAYDPAILNPRANWLSISALLFFIITFLRLPYLAEEFPDFHNTKEVITAAGILVFSGVCAVLSFYLYYPK